jgi:hypothetical protein
MVPDKLPKSQRRRIMRPNVKKKSSRANIILFTDLVREDQLTSIILRSR